MINKIRYAMSSSEEDVKKIIYCGDLDKKEYDSKYKGKLTCVKGCSARIKFTERKDGIKFFSTWNKDGSLHNEYCPYYVEYKGKIGRKKLNAYYKKIEPDEDAILASLQRKMDSLLRTYSENIDNSVKGSVRVENIGDEEVQVFEDEGEDKEYDYTPRIHYEDADFVDIDDIGCRKGVYGYIDNVQVGESKDTSKYAYLNLRTKHNVVNIVLPEAFYSNELSSGVEEFDRYIHKVKKIAEKNPGNTRVIAYGEITRKKRNKNGVNVSVISPNRILVNNKNYNQIISE